ncbi:hypothetical protein GCM10010983_52060 [Caulobacter rhizosphaerae]|nr:hypothetical protein GCM10010983_52060 [Caulobacter rhizosphaerae]
MARLANGTQSDAATVAIALSDIRFLCFSGSENHNSWTLEAARSGGEKWWAPAAVLTRIVAFSSPHLSDRPPARIVIEDQVTSDRDAGRLV